MQAIDETLTAIKASAKEAGDYIGWLERELQQTQRELRRAVRNRRNLDLTMRSVHTGVTAKVREILAPGVQLTRDEIETKLKDANIPFTKKGIGVMLTQNFTFTATGPRRGYWSAQEDAA
jgi:hypothetical protein